MPARATSAASCYLRNRLVGKRDQLLVEEDRLDRPHSLPLHLDVLLVRKALASLLRLGEHARELVRIKVTLVEKDDARLDNRGDYAGLRHATPHRANGPVAGPFGDLPDLQREFRGRPERVSPVVHWRRARVGGLSAESDLVALDAEGAKDDAKGKVE